MRNKRGPTKAKPVAGRVAQPGGGARLGKQAKDAFRSPAPYSELLERVPKDEVWEIFSHYDADRSGFIDRRELARVCDALGMPLNEEELAVAFDAVDSNRSGKVSWEEFSAWWRSR